MYWNELNIWNWQRFHCEFYSINFILARFSCWTVCAVSVYGLSVKDNNRWNMAQKERTNSNDYLIIYCWLKGMTMILSTTETETLCTHCEALCLDRNYTKRRILNSIQFYLMEIIYHNIEITKCLAAMRMWKNTQHPMDIYL